MFTYGTAGFRALASSLDAVMFRVGILASIRSRFKRATIGIMVTASHNPECDNGVKVVDPDGGMLEISWEKLATQIANCRDSELDEVIAGIVQDHNIDQTVDACILLGYDTRTSSPRLSDLAKDGIYKQNGAVIEAGIVTTPQLHYLVRCVNDPSYGLASVDGYDKKIGQAFNTMHKLCSVTNTRYSNSLKVDCSNGVGAIQLRKLLDHSKISDFLTVTIYNDGSNGGLNVCCGADYVKVSQVFPNGVEINRKERCCSFDGDADRVIYLYGNSAGKFRMLDGDKIAVLFAIFLDDLLARAGLKSDLSYGCVQTAYANGSSTSYIQDKLKWPVVCTSTGVKHVHKAAKELDVGVYFEANGHGTILFSEKTKQACKGNSKTDDEKAALSCLHTFIDLINETTGDAISDMLAVEIILCMRDMNVEDWDDLYKDLANRQLKVKVQDRTAIKTADAERKVVEPKGFQDLVDAEVAKYANSRCFVRPSGTEDVVRVYAEASTQEDADSLAANVAGQVSKHM